MVLAAILIPVVAAFAGLAWATAMVYGANQEGRRAADFAALATAASLPMFNLSASCQVTGSGTLTLPGTSTTTTPTLPGGSTIPTVTTQPPPTTPSTLPGGSTIPPTTLPGGSTIPPTTLPAVPAAPTPPLPVDPINNPQNIPCTSQAGLPLPPYTGDFNLPDASVDITNGACDMAFEQFKSGRSMVTGVFFDRDGLGADCHPTPVFTEPWEQQLANCLSNYNVAAGCASNLQQSITGDPNAKVDSSVALVQAVLKEKTGKDIPTCQSLALPAPAQCVGTSNLLTQVQGAQAAVCSALGQAGGCAALQPLIDQLGKASVNTDLRMLAPGLLTPAVQVRVHQKAQVPGLSLLGLVNQDVTNTATARRVFKNAVLLPSLPLPDWTGGYSLDPNTDLAAARQPTLDLLRGLNSQMTPVLDTAMKQVVCPSNPSSCGVNDAFGEQIDDVSDIYDPPPGGAAPSASDMLTNAQNAGSALVVSPLRELNISANPNDPTNTSVCSNDPTGAAPNCLTAAAATALKGILGLSSQVYVPALQFVPVLLEQGQGFVKACPLVIDGMANTNFPTDLPKCTADFMANATKLKGLFRARLIG
jgi:hypothetical protein